MKEKLLGLMAATPVADENWEDIARNMWSSGTDPYTQQLFGGAGWVFYAFLMATTVMVAFVKSESLAGPIATLIIMGTLLSGMLTIGSIYYFVLATSIALGLLLYLVIK